MMSLFQVVYIIKITIHKYTNIIETEFRLIPYRELLGGVEKGFIENENKEKYIYQKGRA